MINESRIVETEGFDPFCKFHRNRKCLSWSAILGGAIVGTGISFLLNLFGLGIGLTAFTNTPQGVSAFAIGGFIGLIIVAIVSMFVAGMVAGFLGRRYCIRRNLGILYGFLAWSVALFLVVLLSGPVASFFTRYNETMYHVTNSTAVANPSGGYSSLSAQGPTASELGKNDTNSAAMSTEKKANDLGKFSFVTFILFAIGAFSACIGGHVGMLCCRNEDELTDEQVVRKKSVVR